MGSLGLRSWRSLVMSWLVSWVGVVVSVGSLGMVNMVFLQGKGAEAPVGLLVGRGVG